MLKKGSKLYSILTGTCPKCQNKSMYKDKNPYHVTKLYAMHETCSHCNLKYMIEPSFFYGAMYVSYGFSVAFGVAIFVISFVFLSSSIATSFISILIGLIVFMPVIARLSRNVYINMFVSYDKSLDKV